MYIRRSYETGLSVENIMRFNPADFLIDSANSKRNGGIELIFGGFL
jgi:hypothetical protein